MKQKSLELVELAKLKTGMSERAICRELGLEDTAIGSARKRGNLSPGLAAALADLIGEDVGKWMLTAAAEGERGTSLKARITRLAESLNSYFSNLLKRPRPSQRNRKP